METEAGKQEVELQALLRPLKQMEFKTVIQFSRDEDRIKYLAISESLS